MAKPAIKINHDTLVFVHTNEQKFIPWCMPKTQYKLLHADVETGKYAIVVNVEKDCVAPLHHHTGPVEIFILEGEFHYPEDKAFRFTPGTWVLEADQAVHQPMTDEGCVFMGIFHGPLAGVDENGKPGAAVDAKWHLDQWVAAGYKVPGQK